MSDMTYAGIAGVDIVKLDDVGDPMTQILKGHLAIEAVLSDSLLAYMSDRRSLEEMRLSFARKVQLAVALGLIKTSDKPAFMALNSVRNILAHDYHYKITEQDSKKLMDSFSRLWQTWEPFTEMKGTNNVQKQFGYSISILWVLASRAVDGVSEMKAIFRRLHETAQEMRQRTTLPST